MNNDNIQNIQHLYRLLRILDPQSPQPPYQLSYQYHLSYQPPPQEPQPQSPPPQEPQPQSPPPPQQPQSLPPQEPQSQPFRQPQLPPVSFSNIFTNLISTGIRTYLGQQEPPQWIYRTMEFISYVQDNMSDDEEDNEKNPIKYEGRVKRFENEPGDEKECSICFEQYCINDEIALTKCNHYFHVTCIEKWLGHAYNCPVCRSTEI